MASIDLTTNGWVDLIFEGRNKEYGAYKLRRNTPKRNIYSIVVIALFAALFIGVYVAKSAYDQYQAAHQKNEQVTELSALNQPKKQAKVERKQIQIPEKKQEVVKEVKSSIKFTAPVIKKDNQVKPEDEMKTQQELMQTTTAIGALDVKGNSENGEVLKVTQRVADEPVKPDKPEVENKVFDVVEQMPSFPGGNSALMQYLSNNIKYPVVAQENGVQGRVVVSFVVERDGSITDVRVVRSVDPSLDREATRVVKAMPNWIPGKQNGSAVRVKYNVPVSFRLQ
ncbi:MAG: energy transducer TonB [Prevotella sp.]|nr:energy transducer TonB [Prevotella sp.]